MVFTATEVENWENSGEAGRRKRGRRRKGRRQGITATAVGHWELPGTIAVMYCLPVSHLAEAPDHMIATVSVNRANFRVSAETSRLDS